MLLPDNEVSVARDFRKELLPVALDNIAKNHPDRSFALIANDACAETGFWEVSYQDLAVLANKTAWWLEETLGKPSAGTFPTLTYIGVGDLRYYALLLACIKVGYKASPIHLSRVGSVLTELFLQILLPSLANPVPMLEKLMKEARSEAFLFSSGSQVADIVRSKTTQRAVMVPELDTLQHLDHRKYAYTKTPEQAAKDPVCIFHTSGTTGFPKVRICTHAHIATRISAAYPPSSTGRSGITRDNISDKRRLILGTMGYVSMLLGLVGPIWGGRTSVMAPLHMSVPQYTSAIFTALVQRGRVNSAFIFPKMCIDIAQDEKALLALESLQHVSFGGGPIPGEVTTALTERTQLNSCWSSTETGVLALQEPDEDARDCYVVDNAELNLHFEKHTGDLYELQIRRNEDCNDPFAWHQAVFVIFPELDTWHTGDLFSRHPTKRYHWRSRGRIDDMIVGSIGQSVNPGPTEQACMAVNGISAAICTGHMKATLGLLVELEDELYSAGAECERELVLKNLLDALDVANADRQTFERVVPDRVVVAEKDRPLPRSPKGLVQRKRAQELYREEIEACFAV